ncbi:hypothetical protein ABD91_25630 [Lysinibacillus sphaericus]|uniref:stalk domain-containing protein n=1 Tax=Lysinibacillus sphaericus TaxID=1421 RepID=UPI0018CE1110|nr:stalk domain-containing protein [Lysinibacillus sphaericus]MBG9694125.1 hypothetical protein [Lysinibacillus sphaericus]
MQNMKKGSLFKSKIGFGVLLLALIIAISTFSLDIPKFSLTNHSLYLNGEKAKINPIVQNGHVYVPLEISVEGMGDKYELNLSKNKATVTHDNSHYIFTLSSAVVEVNGANEYLHVKESKWTTAPTGLKTIKIGSDLFVPYESLNQLFDYEVSSKKSGAAYTVIVGSQDIKEDKPSTTPPTNPGVEENPYVPNKWKESPTGLYQALNEKYPLPEGIKPFKAKSTAFTTDYKKNINILANELGFEKAADNAAILYPYSTLNSISVSYSTKHNDYAVQIDYWSASGKDRLIENVTPYAFKEISNLFFGTTKGSEFYSLIEKGAEQNSEAYKKFNKKITVGNREVYVNTTASSFIIYISEPNKKLDM